jgi:putative protein-disulfide isomerase
MTKIKSVTEYKMKVVYVYDALCGWCYGFSPVISKFYYKHRNNFDFEVISGGMIIDNRIGPIGEVASYIKSAYKIVEKETGVTFGKEFLDKILSEGEAIFTSIPPAIALSVFKTLDSEYSLEYAVELQKAIYFHGIKPENLDAYGQIASKFGLDAKAFVLKMKDPMYKKYAEEEFKTATTLGVTGFPSVFVENEGVYYQIGNAYLPFHILEKNFLKIKNN